MTAGFQRDDVARFQFHDFIRPNPVRENSATGADRLTRETAANN
jgi:hypothetical protein